MIEFTEVFCNSVITDRCFLSFYIVFWFLIPELLDFKSDGRGCIIYLFVVDLNQKVYALYLKCVLSKYYEIELFSSSHKSRILYVGIKVQYLLFWPFHMNLHWIKLLYIIIFFIFTSLRQICNIYKLHDFHQLQVWLNLYSSFFVHDESFFWIHNTIHVL